MQRTIALACLLFLIIWDADARSKPASLSPATRTAQQSSGPFKIEIEKQPVGEVQVIKMPTKDGLDIALFSINVVIAIVGIIGIIIAIFTLKKLERQIGVAEADTQAMIRAERPWIVIGVKSPSPGLFIFTAENAGKTPAQVKSIWSSSIWTPRNKVLDIPSDTVTREPQMNNPPCLIPPGGSKVIFRYDERETPAPISNTVEKGFVFLRFYGRIIYDDVLQPLGNNPSPETRWLYWYVPVGPMPDRLPFQDPMHPEHNFYS